MVFEEVDAFQRLMNAEIVPATYGAEFTRRAMTEVVTRATRTPVWSQALTKPLAQRVPVGWRRTVSAAIALHLSDHGLRQAIRGRMTPASGPMSPSCPPTVSRA